MSDKKDKIFPKGMYVENPREGAPDFVKGSLSIKIAEAIPFLEMHQNNCGYVRLDLKESISGKLYLELNTWQPKKDAPVNEVEDNQAKLNNMDTVEYPEEDINPDEIPF